MRIKSLGWSGLLLLTAALAIAPGLDVRPASAAAVYDANRRLSPEAIAQFMSNPSQLLTQFPVGNGQMTAAVRDLLASDSDTLSALIGLLANCNIAQRSALAAGLGQAAKLYGASPDDAMRTIATNIQEAVAATKDKEFILAYTAAVGDLPIAAGGVGGGGGGGGGGGQTNSLTQNGGTNTGSANIGNPGVSAANFSGFTSGTSAANGSSRSVSP